MRRCVRCGKESDTSFCTHCGGKVEDVPQYVIEEEKHNPQSRATLDMLNALNSSNEINQNKDKMYLVKVFSAICMFILAITQIEDAWWGICALFESFGYSYYGLWDYIQYFSYTMLVVISIGVNGKYFPAKNGN